MFNITVFASDFDTLFCYLRGIDAPEHHEMDLVEVDIDIKLLASIFMEQVP